MALSIRFAGKAPSLLRQVKAPATTARAFTTRLSTRCLYAKSQAPAVKNARCIRLFSSSKVCYDQTQTAPSAKAYLESGVIKGAANPVNVKKVLVIGSGGLSIGQAGEFDYSGWYPKMRLLGMSHGYTPQSTKELMAHWRIQTSFGYCEYSANHYCLQVPKL